MKNRFAHTVPYLVLFAVAMMALAIVAAFYDLTLFFIQGTIALVTVIAAIIIYFLFARYVQFSVRNSVKNIKNAKAAIKKAFENQINGKGFSLIEVVSTCPTNWGMTPKNALTWLEENMLPYYPLGVYKDRSAKEAE